MNAKEKLPVLQSFYSRWESGAPSLSKCAALISIASGAAVLTGWLLNIPLITSSATNAIPVAALTAICFICGGLSLLMLDWHTVIRLRERKANEALKAGEEKMKKILDSAYDAFIAIDKDGKIIDWNQQAEKTFGHMRADVLGKRLSETIIPPEYRQAHEEGLHRFMETGDSKILNHRLQVTALRRDGGRFPIELAIFPVEFEGTTTFCAFLQDITERKRAEKEIQTLNEQLVQARDEALQGSRLKSEFLANMSHEIRTPMNAVIGLSDLLRRTNLRKDQVRYVDLIVNSGNSLLQIIDDILIFSKIEAGRLDLEAADFDLIATVESAADLLVDKAREKNLTLTTFIEPDIMQYVRGDAQRLRQVLLNLISNAVKFTERGRILVRASLESSTSETETICFAVSDTGIGISEEGLKMLFSPFTQVDGSSTRRHGGTGLGLTITKRLVELMGGTIDVISTEGKGSTFTFCIPFQRSLRKATEAEVAASFFSSMRMLMLGLPEDEANVVELYAESWGLRSSYAYFSEEALLTLSHAAHEGDPYNFVLLDSRLPDGNAFDFAAKLAEEPYAEKTHLILILSLEESGQFDDATLSRFAGTLCKPIKQSALFNCMVAALRGMHARSLTDLQAVASPAVPKKVPNGSFVLVVEDNQVNQEVAVLLLEELGFNAHVVSNGRQALDASLDENCQLILMDCQMPEMDGFEATRLIREREAGSASVHVPIIAMTAHAMEGDRELCLSAGMDDYLAKPVTIDKLREAVMKWINTKNAGVNTADITRGAEAAAEQNKARSMQQRTTKQDLPALDLSSKKSSIEKDRELLSEYLLSEREREHDDKLLSPTESMLDQLLDEEKTTLERMAKSASTQPKVRKTKSKPNKSGENKSAETGPLHNKLNTSPFDISALDALSVADKLTSDPQATPPRNQQQSVGTQADASRQNSQMTISNESLAGNSAQSADNADISSVLDYKSLETNFGAQSAKKFLNLFVATTPALLSRLETSITANQTQAAKAAAHELKGMCATINVSRMYDLCRALEKSLEKADWSEAEALLAHLKIAYYNTEAAIKKL